MSGTLHPILRQMEPSSEQTGPVLTRDQDVAVIAGAGAGKTRTLVARYVSLLVDRLPLRSVVAITFTKKAAREMRNRVRDAVRRYVETCGLSDDERTYWRDIYAQLDAARIGTIHSLCAEILRHHPAETRLDPRFEMLDEGQMAMLQAQAVDAALGWAAQDDQAANLFSAFSEGSLRRTIGRMLEMRLDVEEVCRALPEDVWSAWKGYLVEPLSAFIDDPAVRSDFEELRQLQTDGILAQAEAADDALAPELRAALGHWSEILEARQGDDWVAISRRLAPLRSVLKQKGRKANWAPARPKEIIARLQERYDEHVGAIARQGINLALDQRLAEEILPSLLRIYQRAVDDYQRAKRRQLGHLGEPAAPLRALDFDDLEGRALHLLRNQPAVRAYWQRQIEALLVDEFQDTNGRQRDLLDILNGDGSKLFIVGDAKQSIYRFRGADVTVFREKKEAIAENGEGFELATSYRAHEALIEILNALLQPVLGESDPERPYVAPFASLKPHRKEPAFDLQAPYLELHLAVGSKSDGALDRAAQMVASRLAALIGNGDGNLPQNGIKDQGTGAHSLDYSDVAILCRASSSFTAYENALEAAGIPFLTVAGRGFYDRPEVRDVLNALQAVADPTDDLALTGLLRSSAFGLSDMGLYRLRRAQDAAGAPSLWTVLEGLSLSQAPDLSFLEDEAQLAIQARHHVQQLHKMVGRTAVADVLKAFLDLTAYRAALLRAGQSRGVNNVDKLLSDAHASEIVGVSEFVDYVSELRDVAPREGEARAIVSGAVQIMTVHQAKGLEFPVVVVGDASRRTPGGSSVLIDERLGIVPPLTNERLVSGPDGAPEVKKVTSAAYRLARDQDKAEDMAESDRLLYVATTRARELLMISAAVSAYKSGDIGTYGWLDRLDQALHLNEHAPSCDGAGDAVHRFSLDLADQPVHCTICEPHAVLPKATIPEQEKRLFNLPDNLGLLQPITAKPVVIDEAIHDADRDPPRRVWRVVPRSERAWAPSWVVGQLVHLAIAHSRSPGDQERDFYAWSAAEARSCGLTDEEQVNDAVRRTAEIMNRFRATSLYGEMTSARRCLHEVHYAITGVNGAAESGIIDVLFQDGRGWTLVEFKTDYAKNRPALEALLEREDYVEQVERYLTAAEELLETRPLPVLCFLNVGRRVHQIRDRW